MYERDYEQYIDMSDPDVKEYLLFTEIDCENKEMILDGILKKTACKTMEDLLEVYMKNNFLPHCKTDDHKLYLYGLMITSIIKCSLNKLSYDDRDHYKNKRIDVAGDLLSFLFKQLYRKMHKDMKQSLQKSYDQNKIINITQLIKSKIITNGIKYALATGNWGTSSAQGVKVGISQVLNRHSYMSTLSHLRRINSPIGKDGKVTLPRQLHGSHIYRICPAETPEGQSCGLVKNLAMSCIVSEYSNSSVLNSLIFAIGAKVLDHTFNFTNTKILINGNWCAYTDDPKAFVTSLRNFRSNLDI